MESRKKGLSSDPNAGGDAPGHSHLFPACLFFSFSLSLPLPPLLIRPLAPGPLCELSPCIAQAARSTYSCVYAEANCADARVGNSSSLGEKEEELSSEEMKENERCNENAAAFALLLFLYASVLRAPARRIHFDPLHRIDILARARPLVH